MQSPAAISSRFTVGPDSLSRNGAAHAFVRAMRRLVLTALAWTALAAAGAAAEYPTLPLGSPAPDFRLPGVDGREYTLESFAEARLVALVFTSNHCPTAQAYEERIKKLAADYAPRGVAVVAINPNHAAAVRLDEMGYTDLGDTFEEMGLRAAHRGFNFPYLDDGPEQATARAYGPVATPHVFILDGERRLRFEGRIDDSENPRHVSVSDTRAALDALLEGREPPVASTRVFGCSVKWKEKAADNAQWLARVAREPVTLEPADGTALEALRAGTPGKLRVINVWATWCGPCVAEFDELVETNLRFRGREFEMITVAAEPPAAREKALAFLTRKRASMHNLIFADRDIYALIEKVDPEWKGALPYTLVVSPEGEVVYRHTGALDFVELRRVIVPALDRIAPWPALAD